MWHNPVYYTLLLRDLIAVLILSIAGIWDWKKREIDPRLWIAPIVIGIAVNVYRVLYFGMGSLDILSVMLELLFLAVVGLLVFYLRVLGGADLLALATLIALYPFPPIPSYALSLSLLHCTSLLPPILEILAYYSLAMAVLLVYNVLSNLRRLRMLEHVNMSLCRKILYLVSARILTLDEFIKKRFYFPVYVPGVIDRKSFDVYEDDVEWREKLRGLNADYLVIASWGIPTVSFIAVSLLIYLLLRFSPLALLLDLVVTQ